MAQARVWIYSRSFDGFFFFGSVLVPGLLYLIYHYLEIGPFLHRPEILAVVFFTWFSALFDAPHILLSFSRTHFDPAVYPKQRWFQDLSLVMSLTFAIGLTILGHAEIFLYILGLYGAWHILRQNIGLLKIYQSKENRKKSRDAKLEVFLFYLLVAMFLVTNEDSINEVAGQLPVAWAMREIFKVLQVYLGGAMVMALIYWVLRTLVTARWNYRGIRNSSWFFALNYILFLALIGLRVHPLVMTALTTVAHNIQYQGWIWAYHRARGFPRWRAPVVLISSLLLGAIFAAFTDIEILHWGVTVVSLSTVYNGFVFWHYFVDGRIWKFSQSPELQPLLQVANSGSTKN